MANLSKRAKTFVKGVAVLTALSTVMSVAGFAFVAGAATPADYGLKEGDTISSAGSSDPDIYIVNEHGYKRLFLNPVIFGFYGHLGGFAKVKNVSPATRDAFGTSGLFRNCETGDQKVYGVESTGEDTGVLHWVNTSGAQAAADDPNFFKKVFCINNNEFSWYAKGTDYTSVNQVPNYSRTPGQPPVGGALSASLASDNPASGTLLETQALADLAHFQVNGSGLVTSVELQRLGISGDTTLSDVFLFVNGARVSDSGNVSSGKISFNNSSGLFSAPANVSVRANVANDTSGQTVGVRLTKVNSSDVSVSGNLMTIATDPATLATLSVGAATGPGNFDPQNDVNVWQANFTINNEDVYFKRFSLREIGSVDSKDVKNLRLFVDGTQVASDPDLDADGYVTFTMNARVLSGTRIVKVMADVVGGSSRTMQFSLRGFYDVEMMDESYMVNVKAGNSFPVDTSASTIGSASVTSIKAADSPASDVVDDASDVVLGKFTLTAFGESIKIETLRFRASVSDDTIDSLRNGRVMINGSQYGSTTTLATTGDLGDASTSYTVNYTLVPGTPANVEIRADLHEAGADVDTVSANDVISVLLEGGDNNNAQGLASAAAVDVPGTTIESNNQTVKEGSMTVAKYTAYANQNVVIPKSSLKLGHYILTGGSTEDVNINTINARFTVANEWTIGTLSNVSVKVTNASGGLVLQTSPKSSVTGGGADNAYSVSFTLPKSQSYHAEIWGTVSSFTFTGSDDTLITGMNTSGTSAQSGGTVTGSNQSGQTLTAAAGTIVSAVSGAAPSNKIVAANTTSTTHAVDFTATNDNFTIYELVLQVDNGATAAAAVSNVILKDGGTVVASAPLNGSSVSFAGLNINVPNNDTKTLTVDLQFGNVGVGAASTAANAKTSLDSFKARDSSGSITSSTTERRGNNVYVHKSYPSVAAVTLPDTNLTGGEKVLSKFNLTANGGTVGLASISWDITKDAATKIASGSSDAKLFIDGTDVSSLGTWSHTTGVGTWTAGKIGFLFTSEYQIPGGTSKLFELKDSISGTTVDLSLITQLKVGNSAAAAPNTAVLSGAASKLTWTDRTSSSHALTTPDWMNDNLIRDSLSQSLN